MNHRYSFFSFIFVVGSVITLLSAQTDYKIVGYYPAWNRSILPAGNIRTDLLTHINHSFAWPTVIGTIESDANVPDAQLISAVHSGGRKVLIALGGWGHEAGFIPVAANLQIRKTFIENLSNFVLENQYDGVDLDWEFPSTAAQRDSLTSFVRDLRSALDGIDSSFLLTMAVPISNWSGQWIDFQKIAPYIDWFNAMAYDIHGSWTNHAGHNAPLYAPPTDYDGSAHQGIQYLHVTRGIPKNKMTLGVPFYGKQFTASALYASQTGVSDVTYTTVQSRIQSGWQYHWDDVSKVPYLSNTAKTSVITFDDTVSLQQKSAYAKTNGLLGIMIWALGQDVVSGKQPLLESIARELKKPAAVLHSLQRIPQRTVLFDNYPNPFNPETNIVFDLAEQSHVTLIVYDRIGRETSVLVNQSLLPGTHAITLNGSALSSGIYFYRLKAGSFQQSKRMVVIK